MFLLASSVLAQGISVSQPPSDYEEYGESEIFDCRAASNALYSGSVYFRFEDTGYTIVTTGNLNGVMKTVRIYTYSLTIDTQQGLERQAVSHYEYQRGDTDKDWLEYDIGSMSKEESRNFKFDKLTWTNEHFGGSENLHHCATYWYRRIDSYHKKAYELYVERMQSDTFPKVAPL